MFSLCLSVILFEGEESPVTITHDALGLTVQGPPLDMRVCVLGPLLVASDGHHKKPVKTCSVQDTCTIGASRQYALLECFLVSSINRSQSRMEFVTNNVSPHTNWMRHLGPERSFK